MVVKGCTNHVNTCFGPIFHVFSRVLQPKTRVLGCKTYVYMC